MRSSGPTHLGAGGGGGFGGGKGFGGGTFSSWRRGRGDGGGLDGLGSDGLGGGLDGGGCDGLATRQERSFGWNVFASPS